LGIWLGYSGTGKTAVAVHSAMQNVLQGRKVLYLSLEEPGANICNRFYSNYFKINYSDLHQGKGTAQAELQTHLSSLSKEDIATLSNLRVEDLRAATPLTADYIAQFLDRYAQEKGFVPELVYIDQMDYLESKSGHDVEWEKYKKVIFEVDDLCNHLIDGKHKFSIWLLHQAGGKMRRVYSNTDISGFSGIIRPADLCFALGKDKPSDEVVTIFSLKCRHAPNFQLDFFADLAHMKFEERSAAGEARANMEQEMSNIKNKKVAQTEGNRFASSLPKPGGAFK
jgi:hypothetical protein